MNKDEKIHYLAKELIPFREDADLKTRKILEEHYNECKDCMKRIELLDGVTSNEDLDIQTNKEQVSPFKGLIIFKLSIFAVFLVVRISIIGIITFNFYNSNVVNYAGLVSNLILFYFPIVGIINIIVFLFYRNKLFWVLLLFDIIVLLFLDDILQFF
ncbi:hypothetical protein [Ornithinibacillus scapharcae]|uniref:hypothetical protein n=1 Tax=Ornithinibacillus scapharcae TaxID=1147159 RepID=UPI000225B082|nr:hypothetical protein [Ornithinibacillus scapharcae]